MSQDKKTSHTPGPWKADRIGKELYISPVNGGFVADMQRDECANDEARAACDADAVLIAAAPDLLAALKDAEGWLNDSDVAYVISHDKGEQSAYCRMMVAIHAAIAKAQKAGA